MEDLDLISTPPNSAETATAVASLIVRRTRELASQIRALEVTADNYNSPEVKAVIDNTSDAIEDIRERGKTLIKAVLDATNTRAIIHQIDQRLYTYSTKQDPDCAYSKLSALLKEKKDAIKAFKLANAPAVPVRAVALLIYATDRGAADLAAKIKSGKLPGVTGYAFAPDEATEKKIVKLMSNNTNNN